MRKRTGILGGTFDPPHIGHLIIADQVLHQLRLDEIRFMPNHIPPHKEIKTDSAPEDRLKMLQLAVEGNKYFKIETIELKRKGTSYTYDTMVQLKKAEPDTEFFFIIGGDMIDDLPNWHKIDELVKLVKFVGVDRPFYKGKTDYPVHMIDIPLIHVSSTMIRKKIAAGQSVKYLLPDPVITFIEENHLYGARKST